MEGDVGDGMVIEMAENAAVVKSNIDNNGDEFGSVIKSGISTREAISFFSRVADLSRSGRGAYHCRVADMAPI